MKRERETRYLVSGSISGNGNVVAQVFHPSDNTVFVVIASWIERKVMLAKGKEFSFNTEVSLSMQ